MDQPVVLVGPARFVLLPVAEAVIGYTVKAMEKKIERGDWAEGKEYRKAPDGHVHIDWQAVLQRDAAEAQPTCLYRHFDASGRLLYVGISNSVMRRWALHQRRSHWASLVTRIEIERFPSRRAAMLAEGRAIASERPLHNIAGSVSRLGDPS